jgi:hypothetical protein
MSTENNDATPEKTCPNCGHRYAPEVSPGLGDGCPKCLAEFLADGTEVMDQTRDPGQPQLSAG